MSNSCALLILWVSGDDENCDEFAGIDKLFEEEIKGLDTNIKNFEVTFDFYVFSHEKDIKQCLEIVEAVRENAFVRDNRFHYKKLTDNELRIYKSNH